MFPAHWAPRKEDSYRAENPSSWMDQEEAPANIRKQWQEARTNRRCSSRLAIIEMVTEKATFVCQLAPLKQIGWLPAEKLQLSVFLPNDLSLDDWWGLRPANGVT